MCVMIRAVLPWFTDLGVFVVRYDLGMTSSPRHISMFLLALTFPRFEQVSSGKIKMDKTSGPARNNIPSIYACGEGG